MKKFCLLLLFIWLPFEQVNAVNLTHLYETKVYVQDKSRRVRVNATRQSLEKILIKVSGNVKISSIPEIQNQLAHADKYLQRYSYQRADASPGFWLKTNFNPISIKRLLVTANQAVWGQERPQIITWMVIRQNPEDQIVYSNSESQIPRLLYQYANFRGLPLILPLDDKQALTQVTPADIINQRLDKLSLIAKRYTAPTLLVVSIVPGVMGPWEGDWTLLVDGEKLHWQNHGDSLANTLEDGVNNATDLLASRYAVLNVMGSEGEVDIEVSAIENTRDYARVTQYLEHLNAVKKVEMREIKADVIRYHLFLNGDIHALTQSMKLHPLIIPANNATHTLSSELLQFRLRHAA